MKAQFCVTVIQCMSRTFLTTHIISVIIDRLYNGSYVQYWGIGTTICVVKENAKAINRVKGYVMKPYDVTSPWYEFNLTLGEFVENPSLSVEQYDSGLSARCKSFLITYFIVIFALVLPLTIVLAIILRINRNKEAIREEEYYNRPEVIERYQIRRRPRRARRVLIAPFEPLPPSHEDNPAISVTAVSPAYDNYNQPPSTYDVIEQEKLAEEDQNRDLPFYHSLNVSVIDNLERAAIGYQGGGVVTEVPGGVATLPFYQLQCEQASNISQDAISNTVEATPVGVVNLSSPQIGRVAAPPV